MTVRVYEPCPHFPPVSLSSGCMLNCRHCCGRYLDGMTTIAPPELRVYAQRLVDHGAHGFLVSGGSDCRGRLLHLDDALDDLAVIRRETGLIVAVHTGIVDDIDVSRLRRACDVAFVDVVGSDATARLVIGLESAAPYRRTLETLIAADIPVTPHVTLGLHKGRILGERAAIDFVASQPVEKTVINVVCPTPGTPFSSVVPPPTDTISSLLIYAVDRLDAVALGCMRPRGRPDIEQAAVAAGVRDIVLPSRETMQALEADGFPVERLPVCCGLPQNLL